MKPFPFSPLVLLIVIISLDFYTTIKGRLQFLATPPTNQKPMTFILKRLNKYALNTEGHGFQIPWSPRWNNCSFFHLIHLQRINISISRAWWFLEIGLCFRWMCWKMPQEQWDRNCNQGTGISAFRKTWWFDTSNSELSLNDLISVLQILCTFWKSDPVKASWVSYQKSLTCCQSDGYKEILPGRKPMD